MKEILNFIENPAVQQAVGLLTTAWLFAFTKKQRDYIVDRDGSDCVAPFNHPCKPEHLEVHHILPQRFLKFFGVDPDQSTNGITLCKEAHHVIHPDVPVALHEYHQAKTQGRDSFLEMFNKRQEKLKARQVFWNDEFDRPMQVVSMRNQQKFDLLGKLFPKKGVK